MEKIWLLRDEASIIAYAAKWSSEVGGPIQMVTLRKEELHRSGVSI
jgi:hypothetical protein